MQQTVSRFEKYLGECRQWIEELEQLLLSDFDRNSINFNSSVLQSLPKVLSNVHEFFVHVAAKVIESVTSCCVSPAFGWLASYSLPNISICTTGPQCYLFITSWFLCSLCIWRCLIFASYIDSTLYNIKYLLWEEYEHVNVEYPSFYSQPTTSHHFISYLFRKFHGGT